MQEDKKLLQSMQAELQAAKKKLNFDAEVQRYTELQTQMSKPDFWQDQANAEQVVSQFSAVKQFIHSWQDLESELQTASELSALESTANAELHAHIVSLQERLNAKLNETKYTGQYDKQDAIVQLSAGAGGTDAQDWCEMLAQMYVKYANSQGYSVSELSNSPGEEAGLKSVGYKISGLYAYGNLVCEKGVHRLVRLSPFNSDNLRQTSFVLVDVLPDIPSSEVVIDEKDLKIDVYRSGGKGGQSVNTTDSAVRITHIPTGISVAIQNERSQLKNKQQAMAILYARLLELASQQKLDDISQLRGNVASADFGSQIRSYTLHPYQKVKDHRTGHESQDPQDVLGGNITPFINACLDSKEINA